MQLFELFLQNIELAFQAVGGVMAVIPSIEQLNLMPREYLAHLVSIGQASPGPNMLLIPLVGWHVDSMQGALVATLGFCLPSAILVSLTFNRWTKFKNSAWKNMLQELFTAIGVAAVALSTFTFVKIINPNWVGLAIIITVAALSLKTKIPPILLILSGAFIEIMSLLWLK